MSNCLITFAYLEYIHLTLFYILRNSQYKNKKKNISVTLANAAKAKTFQDKGNKEVIEKLKEFSVGSSAGSKKTSGVEGVAKGGGGRKQSYRYHYSSSDYDEDSNDDEFKRELRRRRKWSKRKSNRSRSRSASRHNYDDVSISTITGEPRDCSPPFRRAEKSDSL